MTEVSLAVQLAHRVLMDQSGIKSGDMVKILRLPDAHEPGYFNPESQSKIQKVGATLKVGGKSTNGACFSITGSHFNICCLQKVTGDMITIEVEGKKVEISRESAKNLKLI